MQFDIRPIEKSEYEAAKKVWHACFPEDGQAFVDYYFQKRTGFQYVLAAFTKEGGMVGAMHILPYPVRFFGVEKRACMVAGVGVLPAYRHRGVSAGLFQAAFPLMKERGFCMSVLQPFNVDFYHQYGYGAFAKRNRYEVTDPPRGGAPSLRALDAQAMLQIYEGFCAKYNGMMARTLKDCELLLEELTTYGAKAVTTGDAYALFSLKKGRATVMELAGNAPFGVIGALLKAHGSVAFYLPPDMAVPGQPLKTEAFNMIKVLDEDAFLDGLDCKTSDILNESIMTNYSLESY